MELSRFVVAYRDVRPGEHVLYSVLTDRYIGIDQATSDAVEHWTRGRRPADAAERETAKVLLEEGQAELGRPEARCAALIPIKKSSAWWQLTQDERRGIFEDKSHHIAATLKYLPMIARQLYHCRDLGEPFDFLTWFEYAPEHSALFEDLVGMLRATEEWTFVEREVDVRVMREA